MPKLVEPDFAPYISIVTTSRNDNFGGRLLERMQNFIDSVLGFSKKHGLSIELVFVEWNPPANTPRLKEVLNFERAGNTARVKIIEVPSEIHKKHPNFDKTPFFEYHGKNVGIKRARGEYVLATNNDLIFDEELIKTFAKQKLEKGVFYRIDRCDIGIDHPISPDLPLEERLVMARRWWFRRSSIKGAIYRLRNISISKRFWYLLSRIKYYTVGAIKPTIGRKFSLHRAATGDFFMMSKNDWMKLQAFPETPYIGKADGYMLAIAASSGLKQVVFRERVYHQEHDRSERLGDGINFLRPIGDYYEANERISKMLYTRTPWTPNDENWGLAQYKLPVEEVHPAQK